MAGQCTDIALNSCLPYAHTGYKGQGGVDDIWCIATFPDDRLVSGSEEGLVKVWSLNEGGNALCTHLLQGYDEALSSVATLSDRWVISGSEEGVIKIWDLKRPDGNYCTDISKAHTDKINYIETLPDMWFYSGSEETINVWFLTEAGKALRQHTLSVSGPVSCGKVLSDGQLFAGTYCGNINFWRTTKESEVPLTKAWQVNNESVKCIATLPEGLLITHSADNVLNFWDLKKPEIPCVSSVYIQLPLFKYIRRSQMSPNGQLVISSNSSYTLIVSFKNGLVNYICYTKLFFDVVTSFGLLSGGQIATGTIDGSIGVWNCVEPRSSGV